MKNINCLLIEDADVAGTVSPEVKDAILDAAVVIHNGYVVKNKISTTSDDIVNFISSTDAKPSLTPETDAVEQAYAHHTYGAMVRVALLPLARNLEIDRNRYEQDLLGAIADIVAVSRELRKLKDSEVLPSIDTDPTLHTTEATAALASDTPETDEAWETYYASATEGDPWGLASKLERERDDARRSKRQMVDSIASILCTHRDPLQGDLSEKIGKH